MDAIDKKGLCYLNAEPRIGKTLITLRSMQWLGVRSVLWLAPLRTHKGIWQDYEKSGATFKMKVINPESIHKLLTKKTMISYRTVSEHVPDGSGGFVLSKKKVPIEKTVYVKSQHDDYDMVVVDEAHGYAAFPTPSRCFTMAREVAKGLPVIYLSGTACPESPCQWFHQIKICSHPKNDIWKEYSSFYNWAKNYVKDGRRQIGAGRFVNDYTQTRDEEITACLKDVVIVIKQTEVGGFAGVKEEILTVTPPEHYIKAITQYAKKGATIFQLIDGEEICLSADTAVNRINRIHQMCSGTLIHNEERKILFKDKVTALTQYCIGGRKLAVYYHYIAERELLLEFFGDRATDDAMEFERSDNKVFIGHVRAAREGINLSTASHIAIISPPWSQTSYSQIRERANLHGKDNHCVLLWVVSDFGDIGVAIENRIIEAVRNKKTKMETILRLIGEWGNEFETIKQAGNRTPKGDYKGVYKQQRSIT